MRCKGSIFHQIKLGGKIVKQIDLKAKVEPRGLFGKVGVRQQIWVKGSAHSRPGRTAKIKLLDVRYIFTSAVETIKTRLKAKLFAGWAKDFKIDATPQTGRRANLDSIQPADEMTVNTRAQTVRRVRLLAYFKAGMSYLKKVVTNATANLIACVGAVAKYRKAVRTELTTPIYTAGTVDCKNAHKTEVTAVTAESYTAPGTDVPVIDVQTGIARTAKASAAGAAVSGISVMPQAKHYAKMATWQEPVVVDGVLILRQAYSATQENNVLVVS